MKLRWLALAGVVLALPLAVPAADAPPEWVGLWETEAAVGLRATGQLTPPKLWERNARGTQRSAAAAPLPTDFPPTVKACAPAGFPTVMELPVPDMLFELLVTRAQTLLVATDGTVRHIYTDGRQHPSADELWPTPEGHSIGRWEGATLVIDTIARTAGAVSPIPGGVVLSDQAHFTERLRRVDEDTLQNEMTIDDPARLDGPWRLVMRYKLVRDVDRMVAVNCRENDRNPVVDGQFIISAP